MYSALRACLPRNTPQPIHESHTCLPSPSLFLLSSTPESLAVSQHDDRRRRHAHDTSFLFRPSDLELTEALGSLLRDTAAGQLAENALRTLILAALNEGAESVRDTASEAESATLVVEGFEAEAVEQRHETTGPVRRGLCGGDCARVEEHRCRRRRRARRGGRRRRRSWRRPRTRVAGWQHADSSLRVFWTGGELRVAQDVGTTDTAARWWKRLAMGSRMTGSTWEGRGQWCEEAMLRERTCRMKTRQLSRTYAGHPTRLDGRGCIDNSRTVPGFLADDAPAPKLLFIRLI